MVRNHQKAKAKPSRSHAYAAPFITMITRIKDPVAPTILLISVIFYLTLSPSVHPPLLFFSDIPLSLAQCCDK